MTFTEEERETLIEGLEALRRRLRDTAHPRPSRRDAYRQYYLAAELAERIATEP